MVTALEQIYEEECLGFSYGFRPGRSQHRALDALWMGITNRPVNWVLDADISGFFDAIDHEWMLKFLQHRIGDRRILRLIRKWLRAGVSEAGQWSRSTVGTPQGAVISPLLANIYLHYVLDLWSHQWRGRKAKGAVIMVRYTADFVLGFQYREAAEQYRRELAVRLSQFGLQLHPEKTRLIEFGRRASENRRRRGQKRPDTFTFLGFRHICAKGRKGGFTIRRKTEGKRLRRKLKKVRAEQLRRRHDSLPEQGKWVRSVLQGYFIPCGPGQQRRPERLPQRGVSWLVPRLAASEPESEYAVAAGQPVCQAVDSQCPNPPSSTLRAFWRSTQGRSRMK